MENYCGERMEKIVIRELCRATNEEAAQLQEMMNHLTTSPRPRIDAQRLATILESPHATIFVAEVEGRMVGSLTAVHYLTPVSEKFWIEDVVVVPSVRGMGVGRALVLRAVEFCRNKHPQATLYLTSNPTRIAARQLYHSVGFEEYETGVFCLKTEK